jgi:dienelactone hydrolase
MRKLVPLLFAALVACVPSAFAAPQARPVEWKVGKRVFSGVLVHDDAVSTVRPGLLMVPDWLGVTDAAVAKAKQVAGGKYVVLVADMYGKGAQPKNADEAGAATRALYADRAELRARVGAALAALKAQAGKAPLDAARVGVFGYCFGGAAALELARSGTQVAGVVTFHGGLSTSLPAQKGAVREPLLILNGADDSYVARDVAAFKREMDAAGADWQFVDFSGAVHCFALEQYADNPPGSGCRYDARAAKRAYKMMDDFWDEVFAK